MIDKLKDYFNQIKVTKYRIQHIEDIELRQFIYRLYYENQNRFSNITFFVNCLIKNKAFKRCLNCNKLLTQNQINGKCSFCSHDCAMNNSKTKQKRNNTILKKYGVKNISQNQQIKIKKKKTCFKHYGVEYASQNETIKQKTRKTNIEKYGVEYCLQNEELKEKMFKTNIEKYGTKNPNSTLLIKQKIRKVNNQKYGCNYASQNEKIKQKIKQTNIEKYGVQNISQLKTVKQKKKKTNLEKYGVECPLLAKEIKQKTKQTNLQKYNNINPQSSEIIKQKIKQTNLQKYGAEYPKQSSLIMENIFKDNYFKLFDKFKEYVIPMFDYDEYCGYQNNQIYKWKCVKCGNIFYQNIHTIRNDQFDMKIPICRKCYPYINGFSVLEKQLLNYIKTICNDQIIQNSRLIISPYQIDIYIPNKKIGIQFDGLIWHSNKFKKDDFNLLHKTERCQELGIKLIHIFEDQWLYNRNFVQKMIELNFNQNINIFDYAEKYQNNQYVFDRRYFSKLDFKNENISYIEPQKFYINSNQRSYKEDQFYIFDCGKFIIKK